MVSRHALFACAVLGIPAIGCGALGRPGVDSHVVSSPGVPILVSVAPEAASAGNSVTLQGQGFSFVAQENVVVVGDASTVADQYLIAEDGTESLTFTLPDSASAGETQVLVVVEDNASNTLPFTVDP